MNAQTKETVVDIAIVGAGFGGLTAAARLLKENRTSFVVLERASEVGGTWRENRYPGCACDVPSHLYSFSFAPNPNWSRLYSRQPEILHYLKETVAARGLAPYLRFDTDVVSQVFSESEGRWRLTARNGAIFSARVVVSATGPLNRQHLPAFKGKENFKGPAFHSARWDESFDWKGKKVAIIGTGASAIQIVPEMAPGAAQLYLFQRTPPWVTPRNDRRVTKFEQKLFKAIPPTQRLYREGQYWLRELLGLSFFGNQTIRKLGKKMALEQINKAIADPELRKKVTPDYEIGCKRVLVSDDYYPALTRPNVELITEAIEEILPDGIRTADGKERKLDAIVYCTGFVASEIIIDAKIIGRQGRSLLDEWKADHVEAYYGVSVSGFPNLIFLLGPNSGLGHNSVLHMIDSQVNYLTDYLKRLDSTGQNGFLDVKPEAQRLFNERLQQELTEKTVWGTGCQSWYYDSKGRNTTLWSGLTVSYRKQTKRAIAEDYQTA